MRVRGRLRGRARADLRMFYEQRRRAPALRRWAGRTLSRNGLKRATGEADVVLLGRIALLGAIEVLNRLGLGPFHTELTGVELRRAGLLAMARVADTAPDAEHVIFGHTHRAGPPRRRPAGVGPPCPAQPGT